MLTSDTGYVTPIRHSFASTGFEMNANSPPNFIKFAASLLPLHVMFSTAEDFSCRLYTVFLFFL